MKKLLFITVAILFTAVSISAQDKEMKMKHHGDMYPIHQKMMDNEMPFRKYMMFVEMMPKMRDKLSLTTDQTEKLIDLRADFKKQKIDLKAQQAKEKMKLQNLLMNKASSEELEKQMLKCAGIKVDIKLAAYETAGKMKDVLTDEQKEKMEKMHEYKEEMHHKSMKMKH